MIRRALPGEIRASRVASNALDRVKHPSRVPPLAKKRGLSPLRNRASGIPPPIQEKEER
ncbi:MAG TPA: hypothetical protein VMV84_01070 [Dehalococcoidales bacterium]|nr:hypothetical protein [Dehalococcoidales bacterium]